VAESPRSVESVIRGQAALCTFITFALDGSYKPNIGGHRARDK
jgi:hypothetical protein